MRKSVQFTLLLGIVAMVAAGTCLLTRYLVPAMPFHNPQDAHLWVHRQLHLTPAQEEAIEPIERRYARQRADLAKAIRQANAELATIILEDKSDTPRVNAAIEKIHTAQGELQMATIAHVFDMKATLTPEQGDKLLELTAAALRSETDDSH